MQTHPFIESSECSMQTDPSLVLNVDRLFKLALMQDTLMQTGPLIDSCNCLIYTETLIYSNLYGHFQVDSPYTPRTVFKLGSLLESSNCLFMLALKQGLHEYIIFNCEQMPQLLNSWRIYEHLFTIMRIIKKKICALSTHQDAH